MDGVDAGATGPEPAAPGPAAWAAPGSAPEEAVAAPPPPPVNAPASSFPTARVAVPLPLRPMTGIDIVDGAMATVKIDPRTVLTIAAVFVVPVDLASAWVSRHDFAGHGFGHAIDRGGLPSTSVGSGSGALVALVGYFTLPFVIAAVASLLSSWYAGVAPSPSVALHAAARHWWQLIVAWLVVSVCVVAGAIAFVGPGLILLALFVVTVPAIVIEGLGPLAAMRRSAALVRRRFGSCIGVVLLVLLVDLMLSVALGALGAAALAVSWGWAAAAVIGTVTGILTRAFLAAATVLLYLDLRVRTEGLDIEVDAGAVFDRVP